MAPVDSHGPVADGFLARLAAAEDVVLGPLAVRSNASSGRLRPEPEECSLRSPFQRDRDRIVHCKAFRRLKHKTQVFIAPEGDHYRTRLTHTIEATGISRTVARALRLNEDLTEAIGLGHDLGHPPFGHAGEAALDKAVRARFDRPFRHNEHSLRVVDHLERDGQGLNLTHEVRDGILNHTGETPPQSLEGRIVRIVDRVAYINHDIDDALRAGVLRAGRPARGADPPARIDGLAQDRRARARPRRELRGRRRHRAVAAHGRGDARAALVPVRARVRAGAAARGDRARGARRADALRPRVRRRSPRRGSRATSSRPRSSTRSPGMTDRFAVRRFREVYEPKAWSVL